MDPQALASLQALIAKLTPRQVEIVELLAMGKHNGEIATILSISRETVKTHIAKACVKCEVQNRVQLIVLFVRWQTIGELTNDQR